MNSTVNWWSSLRRELLLNHKIKASMSPQFILIENHYVLVEQKLNEILDQGLTVEVVSHHATVLNGNLMHSVLCILTEEENEEAEG